MSSRRRNLPSSVGRTSRITTRTNPSLSEAEASSGRNYIIEKPGHDNNSSDTTTLKVRGVDLDIAANTAAHHTDDYDVTDAEQGSTTKEYLVVRRGQPFDLKVTFNRPYDRQKDDLQFVFDFGDEPTASRQTHIQFILSKEDVKKKWGGWIKSISDNSIVVAIIPAVNCHVGKWRLRIDVVKKTDINVNVYRYVEDDPIYILFNAWCEDDDVYLHDENLRNEYVMAEAGIIFRGTRKKISGKHWEFGQFSGNVLDCCLYLLEVNMNDANRGNVVAVAREISQVVNGPDDNGLIAGNWSGNYAGGTSPMHWNGSGEIYEQYYKAKQTVKYGQCWIFSGLVTTFFRALGIPCRSVTNFVSGHDTNANLTIDRYFDLQTEDLIPSLNIDSVWNFHVWNEARFRRRDLPDGYGGWLVIDATPQELSAGVFACGPTPVIAMKTGDLHLPYDGPFVFAECNGDMCYWAGDPKTKNWRIARELKSTIGANISTKLPNEDQLEDITSHYKHPEGSDEERMVMTRAKWNISEWRESIDTVRDVEYTLEFDEDTYIGQDLHVGLLMKNTSGSPRNVSGVLGVDSTYYTGVPCNRIGRAKIQQREIAPNTEERVSLTLTPDEYFPALTDHYNIRLSAMCLVRETNLTFVDMKAVRLRKPHLAIKAESVARKGEKLQVQISFTNPLNLTLTQCQLAFTGHGLTKNKVFKPSNIDKKATARYSFSIVPSKLGKRELVVTFNSAQIASVTGSHKVTVTE